MEINEDVVKACVTEAKHLLETKIPFKDAVDGALELHKPMTQPEQVKLRNAVVDALNTELLSGIIERSKGKTYATKIVHDSAGRTQAVGRITRRPRHSGRDLAAGAGVEDRLEEVARDLGETGTA